MGKVPDSAAEFTQGYADYLQAPLQPLMDDLGSMTYEVFERDPVKYRQYEEVSRDQVDTLEYGPQTCRRSRLHYKTCRWSKRGELADQRTEAMLMQTSVVTVVGAGRGPLVDCTLRAMKRSGRRARVFAVEKNANAYVT